MRKVRESDGDWRKGNRREEGREEMRRAAMNRFSSVDFFEIFDTHSKFLLALY